MRQVPVLIEPQLDDAGGATVMVDGTVAGRPCRFTLGAGAARTQLVADAYTAALPVVTQDRSSSALGGHSADPIVTVTDLAIGPLRAAWLELAWPMAADRRSGADTPVLRMAGPVADWLFDFPAKRWTLTA